MKILVLNCGSSSIKYKLFDMTTKEVIAQGGIEKIGLKGSFLKLTLPNGEKKVLEKDIPEHTIGVEFILNTLISPEYGAIKSLDEINAVGHRMVHGGERFSESVLLNKEVLEAFAACNDLAPLHNPANLKGVNAVSAILPNIPQVGVFDTAFHQTMPDYAYMYAIPYEMYEKYGVRRYGFHGTSHRYVSKRVCEFLGVNPVGQKIITCHIGNGGSIAAIKDGKCIDTTMGLTPLEGLMMGTRSGDIDAGAVTFIMEKEGLNTTGISNLLIIKTAPGITCVSGAMLLLTHAPEYGKNGILVMGDVAVTPVPDPNQLAQIAVCTAQTAKAVAGIENPKVAMLSFSTKGSAKHEVVDKVVEATKIAKEMAPTLDLDGEMQADAALVPEVGASKAPGSPVAGEANVLIVPSLEVGNISYKLVQRLGHADAIGPILQGIARPVNDLSRGCSIEDVYRMIAITANQAIAAKNNK